MFQSDDVRRIPAGPAMRRPGGNRRALLLGLAAAAVAPGRAGLAQSAGPYANVAVDVARLRAVGYGPYADTVARTLEAALREAFADRMAPRGARLLVRIDGVSLRSYVGGESRFGSSGTPNDYMEGEALVIGSGGAVLARRHQLSALPASSGGAWYLPDNESRRLAALSEHFAGWLRRYLG